MPKQVSPSRMLLGRREIGNGTQNALPERSQVHAQGSVLRGAVHHVWGHVMRGGVRPLRHP
eukprot:3371509-Rhodomonas_salina.1